MNFRISFFMGFYLLAGINTFICLPQDARSPRGGSSIRSSRSVTNPSASFNIPGIRRVDSFNKPKINPEFGRLVEASRTTAPLRNLSKNKQKKEKRFPAREEVERQDALESVRSGKDFDAARYQEGLNVMFGYDEPRSGSQSQFGNARGESWRDGALENLNELGNANFGKDRPAR